MPMTWRPMAKQNGGATRTMWAAASWGDARRSSRVWQTAAVLVAFFAAVLLGAASATAAEERQPNILWITVEDMSANLGCYGDTYATSPHLDQFARESVRYTHAFATAPVCSPVRSCLITGVYATSLGTQRLRSEFPIPAAMKGFPAYLRQKGYFTTNNVKTDYNLRNEKEFIRQAWDRNGTDAHWRQRNRGQPFFSVFNLMTTHQSRTSVWPHEQFEREIGRKLADDERHDPAGVTVPPYYPDTPSVRQTLARYYDCITAMDKEVGQLLRQLEEDGLVEDTIVFYYSDHGMGLPRGKRLLHDTGMHVPLLIRFPKRYGPLGPTSAGQTTDRLVSFVDFAPTVLSLAGIPIPDYMQGVAFLGPQAGPPRDYVFGARDRVDEVFDMSRSVRDHRYLYLRNYMPHLSWMPPERYSDNAVMRQEMKRLRKQGRLNAVQLTYASPTKSVEEFYDSQSDPYQVNNLAGAPEHQALIDRFRNRHRQWVQHTRDTGFLAESEAWRRAGDDPPWTMARDPARYPLKEIFAVASRVGDPTATPKLAQWLGASDPAVRYWAAIGLHAAGARAAPTANALRGALTDESMSVRIEAAAALAGLGETEPALAALQEALDNDQVEVVLRAMRALELMGDSARPALAAIGRTLARAQRMEKQSSNPCWMFVRFSAEAAMEDLKSGP